MGQFGDLFGGLGDKLMILAISIKTHNEILLLSTLLFSILMLFIVNNQLQVKNMTKKYVFFFGVTVLLTIVSYFIVVARISVTMNLVIIVLWVLLYVSGKGNVDKVGGVIFNSDIAESSVLPGSWSRIWSGQEKAMEKLEAKPLSKIKHRLKLNRVYWAYGVPSFQHSFSFEINVSAPREDFYKVQSTLATFFSSYNWSGSRKGKKYEIIAYPKRVSGFVIRYDSYYSRQLPWYIIPLGVVDTSSKSSISNTVYTWRLHGDNKSHKLLENYQTIPAPMGLIIGGTNGGKTVLLKTIIAHLVFHSNVQLYLSDPKGGAEFGSFGSINSVKAVAVDLESSYKIFKEFLISMSGRYNAMGKLGINKLPLLGSINIDGFVSIDGYIFKSSEVVEINTANGSENVPVSSIEPGMEVLIPGNSDFGVKSRWVKVSVENFQNGGKFAFDPMFFISDEYAYLLNNSAGDEVAENMVVEIQKAVESIAMLGRAANVHLLIAMQSPTDELIPEALKNNLHFRTICGPVSSNISKMVFGNDEGESIPSEPAGAYLTRVKGNSVMYQGFYTDSKQVVKLSGDIDKSEEAVTINLSEISIETTPAQKEAPKKLVLKMEMPTREPEKLQLRFQAPTPDPNPVLTSDLSKGLNIEE